MDIEQIEQIIVETGTHQEDAAILIERLSPVLTDHGRVTIRFIVEVFFEEPPADMSEEELLVVFENVIDTINEESHINQADNSPLPASTLIYAIAETARQALTGLGFKEDV